MSSGLGLQPHETLIQEYLSLSLPLKDSPIKEKGLYKNAARIVGLE